MDNFMGMGMEMCEDCHVNPAIIHLTHVVNNEMQTYHLCEDCARERGIPFPDSATLLRGLEALVANAQGGGQFGDMFGDAFGDALVKVTVKQANEMKPPRRRREEPPREEDIKCANCGLKLSEIRAGGCLGCADCYTAFGEHIERVLFQVHGAGGHRGKRYGRADTAAARRGDKKELERLRVELDIAIKNEDFERAVTIRDAMRDIGGKELEAKSK